jgi:hypothetical protein
VSIALLFTGHMTDLPERETPRFPPQLEAHARAAIAAKIDELKRETGIRGFASGARGAEILFHEECRLRGIPTEIILPFRPEEFIMTSVDDRRGPYWPSRFWKVWNETPEEGRVVLDLSPNSPESYARCNAELCRRALHHGDIHLIALWDERPGGGHGGTEHFVSEVRKIQGSVLTIINPVRLGILVEEKRP